MRKRIVVMLLTGILVMSAVFPVAAAEPEGKLAKSETVYVKADADGSVQEITVRELLNIGGISGEIEDYSILSDIRNTEGDEEFRQETDGRLFWENHGANISYEGKSDAELPVSVKVHYYLNDKEMSPEEMAGVSGKVKIRFEYENHTPESVEIDGKTMDVKVPFTVITALMLPSDIFSNVKVSDGKVIADKDQNIVAGIAFPGLADSLRLTEYEPTEDVSIPDCVEVTADVKDFELALTATIVSSGVFCDIDTSDLDDADDLADSMDDLTDASSKLADGTQKLTEGMETMQEYMSDYTQGVGAVSDGAKTLAEGLAQGKALLGSNKEALTGGARKLTEGLASLNTVLAEVEIPSDMSDASDVADSLGDDSERLSENLNRITAALESVRNSLDTVDLTGLDADASAEATQKATADARYQAEAKVSKVLSDLVENGKLTSEDVKEIEVTYDDIEIQVSIPMAATRVQEMVTQAKQCLDDAVLAEDIRTVNEIVAHMRGQMGVLEKYSGDISGMSGTVRELQGALGQLTAGVESMAAGSQMLTQGLVAIDEGIGAAYEGALGLSEGSSQLVFAGTQLNAGLGSLIQGGNVLEQGMRTFDEEGIQKLSDLAGDDLTDVIRRFKALKEADSRYDNYAGLKEGDDGEVKFIIETEEIANE